MRTLVVLALIGLATLAGCMSTTDDGTETPTTVPDKSSYVPSDVPRVDVVDLLADHASFVRDNSDRRGNTVDHENARIGLMERFASYGLEVYRQNFTTDIDQANIIGIKWGQVRDEWVVVGGHYDIVNTPPCVEQLDCRLQTEGAYDDGSGTMMSVHLGKTFANLTPYYTMAFVGYDGEEKGTQGAAAFVNAFVTGGEEGDNFTTPYGKIRVHGAVDLDMLGLNWPGVQAPMNILTNSEVAYAQADNARQAMGWPDEQWKRKDGLQLGSSDYARFWEVTAEQGGPIPTVFFIADFEEVGAPGTGVEGPQVAYTPFGAYPFWHLEDTVETMTAMAGGQDNLELGFQAAADVATAVLYAMAFQPTLDFDAVAK